MSWGDRVGLLDGQTALVTGSGRGMGRGIVKTLAAAGAKIVANNPEGAGAVPRMGRPLRRVAGAVRV